MGKRDIGHFHGKVAILVTPMGKPDIGHGNLRTLVLESIFVNNLLYNNKKSRITSNLQQSSSSSFLFPFFIKIKKYYSRNYYYCINRRRLINYFSYYSRASLSLLRCSLVGKNTCSVGHWKGRDLPIGSGLCQISVGSLRRFSTCSYEGRPRKIVAENNI